MRALATAFALAISLSPALAQNQEDLNRFALVLSIPIYAGNCEIPLDDTAMANIEAELAGMREEMGISDAQAEDLSNQMMDQIGSADCTEGSDERTAFDEALAGFTGE